MLAPQRAHCFNIISDELLLLTFTCMYAHAWGTMLSVDKAVLLSRTFSVESTTEFSGKGGMLHAGVWSQSPGI